MIVPVENISEYTQGVRQALLEAGIEVLGPEEAGAVFRLVQAPCARSETATSVLSQVYTAIKQHYGDQAGQGVGLRLGRSAFKYAMPLWGQSAGVGGSEFRLWPSPRKARALLTAICEHLSHNFNAPAELSEDERSWYLRVESCPACRGLSAPEPDCAILTGILQELMAFAAGGRFHSVEETSCSARGDAACAFRIEKRALD